MFVLVETSVWFDNSSRAFDC